jgi:glutathionylspermidine synthase
VSPEALGRDTVVALADEVTNGSAQVPDGAWVELNQQLLHSTRFTWGISRENGEDAQYLLNDVYTMDAPTWCRIQTATQAIGSIYEKTVRFLQQTPSLFSLLGLPKSTWEAVQVPSQRFSYVTRFDLIVHGESVKVIEANCDTPTGIVESTEVNDLVASRYGVRSPNAIDEAIRAAFDEFRNEHGLSCEDMMHFTAFAWHAEDKATTEHVLANSGQKCARFIGIDQLRIRQDGLYTQDGEPIRLLYRLYPLEYFDTDRGPNGEPIGPMLLNLVASRRLILMNPPCSLIGQSKATMAVIWALHEARHPIYTEADHDVIEQYFLPTYTDSNRFDELGMPYVKKPIFGREGSAVEIVNREGTMLKRQSTDYYESQPCVYQQYIPMPTCEVQTWAGPKTGRLLVGSFYIAGRSAGVFLRVGDEITTNTSWFLPVVVRE